MNSIELSIDQGIARIFLNRPETLNAFTREMSTRLLEALERCANEDVRVVIISGRGRGFCSGQDLAEVKELGIAMMETQLSDYYNPIVQAINYLKKPVIAAVNGVAAGAGANIALNCDIVVASESASFVQAFSKIGLIPDSGGTYVLPRLIGMQKAKAIMFTGEKISAKDAEAWGMIYKTVAADSFESEVEKLAQQLREMPTKALGLIKQALAGSVRNDLESQLELEDRLQQEAANSEDFKEGVAAFLEGRKPEFKGK